MASPFIFPNSFCRNVSDCFPCNDIPTTNTSSESPDVFQDYVINWGPGPDPPPLGRLFRANGCISVCSGATQEEAFLCAQRQQALCAIDNWNPEPPDPPVCLNFPCAPPPPPPPNPPAQDFGNDPQSCDSLCADGTPFTFTVPPGSFIATNQILADRMAHSFACREAILHKVCLNLVSNICCMGEESTLTFVSTGPPLDAVNNLWQITSGSLPPGFSFGPTNAGPILNITGTPTALGDFTFTMRVTAPTGDFMDRQFTVTVAGITNADPLDPATVGTAYSVILAASGIDNTTWVVFDGMLPDGLTLDLGTGEISGTPTMDGEFEFTIEASNEDIGCLKVFHITVAVGCFIDASPNLDLNSFGQQVLARNGGIAVWTDSVTFEGWYYLNHIFQKTPFVGQSQNYVCAAGRYIGAQDFVGPNNLWIDLQLGIIRNLAHTTVTPVSMNDNGDMGLQGGFDSFIYNASSNTFSANIQVADGFSLVQINNSRASVGLKTVGPDVHAFSRSAAGVYADRHPGGGAGTFSNPGGGNQFQPCINSSAHMAGIWNNGLGSVSAFANFGGASIFLSGLLAGIGRVIINDSDLVAYDNNSTGHVFIYNSGVTTDIGNQGVLKGFNNAGIVVGNDFAQTSAWIYANGVVSTLISKIPSAAADGWTSLLTVDDISNDNFVTGFGIKNGVVTIYAATLCI